MEKFIPYEKMSKKRRKEFNQKKRNTWNGFNPITRKSKNSKIYNRKKVLKWNDDTFQDFCFSLCWISIYNPDLQTFVVEFVMTVVSVNFTFEVFYKCFCV